ncbi:MAG TPA: molybdopterin converting factor subunit 1 [Dehalococcoidia bacterium]|jgi:molybdopterin synthase catalytic subunit
MPNSITVRFFARLAELAGVRQTTVDIGEGLTARDVYALLSRRHPGIEGFSGIVMFARNQEYVPAETPLAPGDELALIPPVSGGDELFEVTPEPLDPQRVVEAVRRNEAGAVALFYGIVREQNLGRRVVYLKYDAYPEMAVKVMREIATEVRSQWPVSEIAVQHRTGRLEIGETSLLVAVSSAHRGEAFEACHAYVDRLKERVPIWKKEVFEGGEEWIEREARPRAT